MNRLRRRDLMAGAAGSLALGSCRRGAPVEKPRVAIVRAGDYRGDLAGTLARLLRDQRLDVRGQRILLKPNLVEFDAGAAINTHPLLVGAALEAFRSLGAAEVRIAEGPGHRRSTMELAEAAGYFQQVPGFESLFTDLNLEETTLVRLERPFSRLESVYLPRAALAADLLVSLPKMKTHHWVGATLGMKNLFGLVPGGIYGWPKNVLHWAGIDECIADLHKVVRRMFTIVDGIVGMEGNGPIQGKPKAAGVIVAGRDTVAVDATCCRIMGLAPGRVKYLGLAATAGQTAEDNVEQIGEPVGSVRTPFELIQPLERFRA